ncbi:carboxypeptidase-like regulatory domain-containing protein, partial [Mesonia mobilis]
MKLIHILLFTISMLSYSQQKIEIKGSITSEGKPIPFANISVENSMLGTSADLEGNFVLKIEPGTYTLKIQAVGFKTELKTISIENYKDQPLNIELQEDML